MLEQSRVLHVWAGLPSHIHLPWQDIQLGFPGSLMGPGMAAVRAVLHLAQALQACLDPAFLRDLSGSAPQLTDSSSVSWTKAIYLGNLYA